MKIEALRFDLRYVEHVAENVEQDARGGIDVLDVFLLYGVERRFGEQSEKSDDAVERGPYLVAHIREKG